MKLKTIWNRVWSVYTQAGERHIGLIAAGVAFFGMFGVFPGIAAVVAVFGLVADADIVADQLALMEDVIPEDAYSLLQGQLEALLTARTDTLGWATLVSVALAIWSARAAVAALMGGLNAIEGVPARGGLRQVFVAINLTVCLVALAVVALVAVVVVPVIIAFAPIAVSTAWVLEFIRWSIALAVLFGGLSLLYRFGPNLRGARRPWVTAGAGIVVVVWVLSSAGLGYYLTNFGSYEAVYGSLGAVIGMLLWLYVSAYLVLLGAVVNAEIYGAAADHLAARDARAADIV